MGFYPRADVLAQTSFEAATSGAKCTQARTGMRTCSYKVGDSLEFTILGVGQFDASVNFERSDAKGDFYARIGLAHRCVIIVPGGRAPSAVVDALGQYAFVSPRTGLVYRTWQSCDAAGA
jgi:hypothetical protein